MTQVFSTKFFIGNRKRLRELVGDGAPIVVTAHGLLQRNADNTFPFRQDSNFWYLTGISEPDLILVIDGSKEYLIVPGRSGSREAFDGAIDRRQLTDVSGVKEIVTEEEGWKRLGATLKKIKKVSTLPSPAQYIEQYGMYTNPARDRLFERLNSWQLGIDVTDIREHLVGMRMIKQPEEIKAIQLAIDTTISGLKAVTEYINLKSYEYEYEIENDLTVSFRTRHSSGHAFAPIVASGKRAVTLHNVSNSGQLQQNELIVLDVGAEVSCYAADITRTVVYGTPTKRQRQVYEAVLEVQQQALELIKSGIVMKEYESRVEELIGGKLKDLGLIDSINHDSVRKYYPHATSHFLGLDFHDAGDYGRPLEPGMVLTCEPGIYIPEEGIGVRIEDDVLITENGNTVLSDALPRSLTP